MRSKATLQRVAHSRLQGKAAYMSLFELQVFCSNFFTKKFVWRCPEGRHKLPSGRELEGRQPSKIGGYPYIGVTKTPGVFRATPLNNTFKFLFNLPLGFGNNNRPSVRTSILLALLQSQSAPYKRLHFLVCEPVICFNRRLARYGV